MIVYELKNLLQNNKQKRGIFQYLLQYSWQIYHRSYFLKIGVGQL